MTFCGNHPLDVQLKDTSHTIPLKTAAYNIRHIDNQERAKAFRELIEFVTDREIDVSCFM